MRVVLLAAALTVPEAPAVAPEPPARAAPAQMPIINPQANAGVDCPPISRYDAQRRGGPLAPRNLGDLPMADHYKAVYRTVGGCTVPVIASYRIGDRQR